jgi:hypothetical protein
LIEKDFAKRNITTQPGLKGEFVSMKMMHHITMVSLLLCSLTPRALRAVDSTTCIPCRADAFFADLKADFDKVAVSPVLKNAKSGPVNGLFFKTLKKYQPMYSFIRTNAKGMVINEVIRGENPSVKKRKVSDQSWYVAVSKKLDEYTGFVKEENGRYYLFWAAPIMVKAGGKEKFNGAVVAKIDIWDCFHKIAATTEVPFIVRIERLSLYSNKWKEDHTSIETALTVPGVGNISMRYVDIASQAAAVNKTAAEQARQDSVRAKAALDSLADAAKKRDTLRMRIVVGCGIGIALLLLFVIVRMIMWIRHAMLMRKINRES